MRRTARPFYLLPLSATLAVAVALSGCTSGGTPSSGSGSKDVLTLGMTADITTSFYETPSYQGWAGDALYDSLLQCDVNGKPEPEMAEKWEFSADNTGVTVHIRPGMKFSDGTAVDSAAVKASYDGSLAILPSVCAAFCRIGNVSPGSPNSDASSPTADCLSHDAAASIAATRSAPCGASAAACRATRANNSGKAKSRASSTPSRTRAIALAASRLPATRLAVWLMAAGTWAPRS